MPSFFFFYLFFFNVQCSKCKIWQCFACPDTAKLWGLFVSFKETLYFILQLVFWSVRRLTLTRSSFCFIVESSVSCSVSSSKDPLTCGFFLVCKFQRLELMTGASSTVGSWLLSQPWGSGFESLSFKKRKTTVLIPFK